MMKRFIVVPLILLLMLTMIPLPAYATPATDLGSLARFFPADTPIYAAFGIGEGDIESLDSLLQILVSVAPDEFPPGLTVAQLLDLLAFQLAGDTFQNSGRSWMGDSIALAILDPMALMPQAVGSPGISVPDPPIAIAFSVTDRAALDAFMERLIIRNFTTDMFKVANQGGYTVYTSAMPDVDAMFLLGDDVFMFGNPDGIQMVLAGSSETLADSEAFGTSMALLPAESYNMVMYVATQPFMTLALAEAQAAGTVLPDIAAINPAVAVGLAVFDGPAIAFDMAQSMDVTAVEGQMGITFGPLAPLDMRFAAQFPAETLFALMGSDFGAIIEATESLTLLGLEQTMQQALLTPGMVPLDMEEELAQIEAQLTEVSDQFRMATGLDLQEDVLSWMTGHYGIGLWLNNEAMMTDPPTAMPIGAGVVMEATDPAAVQSMAEQLVASLSGMVEMDGAIKQESIGMGTAAVLAIPEDEMDTGFPVELLMGWDSEVFAIGTRDAVRMALLRDGGLAADPRFVQAQSYMIEDTTTVMYFNLAAAAPLILMEASPAEIADIQLVLRLLRSMSVSGTTYEDGSSVGRVVIALAG
jgi:hypothetical protein